MKLSSLPKIAYFRLAQVQVEIAGSWLSSLLAKPSLPKRLVALSDV